MIIYTLCFINSQTRRGHFFTPEDKRCMAIRRTLQGLNNKLNYNNKHTIFRKVAIQLQLQTFQVSLFLYQQFKSVNLKVKQLCDSERNQGPICHQSQENGNDTRFKARLHLETPPLLDTSFKASVSYVNSISLTTSIDISQPVAPGGTVHN